MSNMSGLPDPTAEKAVANVTRKEKGTRFLPKDLHKAFRVCRSLLELFGYEFTEAQIRDLNGNKYLWGGKE